MKPLQTPAIDRLDLRARRKRQEEKNITFSVRYRDLAAQRRMLDALQFLPATSLHFSPSTGSKNMPAFELTL
jgi:hypothetical protein